MRRILPLLFFAVLLTALVTGIGLAQDDAPDGPIIDLRTVDSSTLPKAMIDGVLEEPPAPNSALSVMSLFAAEPADKCADAEDLSPIPGGIEYELPDDVSTSVDDPVLTCMWGNPTSRQGHRTVWYRLAPTVSGRFTLDSFGSTYDTVLGVFKGECGNLEPVRCEDDVNGFSSKTTIPVSAGEVYYIEVADWQSGSNAPKLSFSALQQPINPLWETVLAKPSSPAISRHATAARQDKLYVLGGQTGGTGLPLVSKQVWRLDTYSNRWDEMSPIPGFGYSNTTAALVDGRIYLPSGYNGSDTYDSLHWVFDPDFGNDGKGAWSMAAPIPTGEPFAWAASAVPPSNDRYYLMGGTPATDPFDKSAKALAGTYMFIPDVNAWLPRDPMPTGRYAHTGAWIETNNLGACVAGGMNHQPGSEQFVFVTVTECYNPSDGWRSFANINIPRIGAGSAVGPDGRWYVFGGRTPVLFDTGSGLAPVLQTEVYDPLRNTWTILPPEYNVGGQELLSARAYIGGNFIENDLYITGGSNFFSGENAVPLTEKLMIPPINSYLPTVVAYGPDYLLPDDNFTQARTLPPDFVWKGSFDSQRDFFDFFTFTLTTREEIKIDLEVPDNNDFDLYLYGENKLEWSSSSQPFTGWDEHIAIGLDPRRYFIMVKRSQPQGQPDKGATYKLKWSITTDS